MLLFVLLAAVAPVAGAQPPLPPPIPPPITRSPWVPDAPLWCPGGFVAAQYCDGLPFPDDTRWHQNVYIQPRVGAHWTQLRCVTGDPLEPIPAPVNGCGVIYP